jgi:hypothetical protein
MIKRLAREDDGAVVVMTIFASAFLIGAMWYLLGIGDALLYKERMQDGADAIAFAPAVVHARGMNLIALLNITMAAVLSVLVAVKIFQVVLSVATVTACLIPYNPDCEYLASKEAPYEKFVNNMEKKVKDINNSLYDTANTVAKMTPILGARRGVDAGKAYAPMVEGAFSASISVVPGDSGNLADNSSGGGGQRLGLPVEDDDFSKFCAHSGSLVDVVLMPTILHFDDGQQTVTTSLKYAGYLVAPLTLGSPDSFCGSGGKKPVTKRIYKPAKHGNDYFATWGFSQSAFMETDKRGEKGLDVATWGKNGTPMSQAALDHWMRSVQVAKSEFYFDPRRGGPRDWDTLKDEALWHLRWRARLRRVSQPNRSLAFYFSGQGLGPIMAANSGSGADIPSVVKTVLAASPQELTAWSQGHLGKVQATSRTGGIVH